MIKQENIEQLLYSLHALLARVSSSSGISAEEVNNIILTYFASDVEAVDKANVSKLVSPKGAYLASKAAIDEWVGAAPEVLDTIEEISIALGGDPDAFNTLMNAIAAVRDDLAKHGLVVQIDYSSRTELLGGPLSAYESMQNGIYLGHASTATILVDGSAPADLNSAITGLLKVQIRPYLNSNDTPPVGEENRKIVRWEYSQGIHSYVRELDTLDGAPDMNYTKVGSGDGGTAPGGSSERVDMSDFSDGSFYTVLGLRAKEPGLYVGVLTKTEATTHFGYAGSDNEISITAKVVLDTVEPGEKYVDFFLHASDALIVGEYGSYGDVKTYRTIAMQAETETAIKQVYSDMADGFSRMGHAVGTVVTEFGDEPFMDTRAANARVSVGFANDGRYYVYNDGVETSAHYWLPYEATASEYQIKRVDVTGAGDSNTTLSGIFASVPANPDDGMISVTRPSAGTTTVVMDVVFNHIATSTETSVRVTLTVTCTG